jgi:hypothetical protein
MLTYFTWLERRFLVKKNKNYGMLNGLVTLSLPIGLLFFFGGWVVFGHAFVAFLHIWGISDPGITAADWKFGFMFLIPGVLLGIPLAKVLHEIAKSRNGDVTAQGRFYTKMFLRGTRVVTALSIALVAAIVVTDLLDTPIDPTNYWWPHLLAVIGFNIPFIRYFQGLRRRWPQ